MPLDCQVPDIRSKYADLGMPSRGFFVEIGGYDGESHSNTSFLADEGWRGLYVEPIPDFYKLIRLRHAFNRVRAENVAVSSSEGVEQISLMGPLTTLSDQAAKAYDSIPWAQPAAQTAARISVRTSTLAKLLAANDVPHDLDLMVIDVEGGEEKITDSLLASHWRPKVLVVELNDLHPDFSEFPELQASSGRVRQSLVAAGYAQYYADEINSIFRYAGH